MSVHLHARTHPLAGPLSRLTRAGLVLAITAAVLLTGHPEHLGGSDRSARTPRVEISAGDLRPVASRATKARRALRIAKRQVGDRYRYGAAGPHRFDCSGLIYFSTHRAGFSGVPRSSSAQGRHMRRIKRSRMRPGDFVFFRNGSGVYHVGVYIGRKDGRRRIVHAPGSGQRVKRAPIWTDRWFAGTLRG